MKWRLADPKVQRAECELLVGSIRKWRFIAKRTIILIIIIGIIILLSI